MDLHALLEQYVEELNPAIESRAFPPFVKKWFTDDCVFSIYDETRGIENVKKLWKHLLPKGGDVPRAVTQRIHKIDGGRVYTFRWLHGGDAPEPLWSLQETQFDDRTLISEIEIHSQQNKPELEADPRAEKSRLGRIFLAFAEAFNEFFETGNMDFVAPWCAPDVRMEIDSSFWGAGVIAPHNRITQGTRFTLRNVKPTGDATAEAEVDFANWGGLDDTTPWKVVGDPEQNKLRELHITLKI